MQPDALSKDDAIADAGLSRRSAYDYQALAGGRDERAQAVEGGRCGALHAECARMDLLGGRGKRSSNATMLISQLGEGDCLKKNDAISPSVP